MVAVKAWFKECEAAGNISLTDKTQKERWSSALLTITEFMSPSCYIVESTIMGSLSYTFKETPS